MLGLDNRQIAYTIYDHRYTPLKELVGKISVMRSQYEQDLERVVKIMKSCHDSYGDLGKVLFRPPPRLAMPLPQDGQVEYPN